MTTKKPAAQTQSSMGWLTVTAILLTTCVVWLSYSHFVQPPTARTESSAATSTLSAWAQNVTATTPAANTAASPASKPAAQPPASQLLEDETEERVESIDNLARRGSPNAVRAVLGALQDDDARVRSRALDAAVNAYVAIPENVLIDRAQADPSPDVRFLALAGIAARLDPAIPQIAAMDVETVRSIGTSALSDSSEEVRWQAQQLLTAIDAQQPSMTAEAPQVP